MNMDKKHHHHDQTHHLDEVVAEVLPGQKAEAVKKLQDAAESIFRFCV